VEIKNVYNKTDLGIFKLSTKSFIGGKNEK